MFTRINGISFGKMVILLLTAMRASNPIIFDLHMHQCSTLIPTLISYEFLFISCKNALWQTSYSPPGETNSCSMTNIIQSSWWNWQLLYRSKNTVPFKELKSWPLKPNLKETNKPCLQGEHNIFPWLHLLQEDCAKYKHIFFTIT